METETINKIRYILALIVILAIGYIWGNHSNVAETVKSCNTFYFLQANPECTEISKNKILCDNIEANNLDYGTSGYDFNFSIDTK